MRQSLRELHRDLEDRLNARFSVEQRLAMKFTRLVCVFVLVSGVMFSVADVAFFAYRVRRDLNAQIDKVLVGGTVASDIAAAGSVMPATVRPYIRVLAPDGTVLYAGDSFAGTASGPVDPFAPLSLGEGRYLVVTRAVRSDGRIVGYVQFAGLTGRSPHEAAWKLLNLLMTTLIMSILAYVFGLSFSRHTLRPIHESQERLEQFTQDASHELRTPLASISSSLDVAMKTGEYEQGFMAAKGQVKYASLLVERLLEVAQLDRVKVDLGPIDMTALVCSVASQNAESCKEHEVTMRTSIEEDVVVEGDGLLLHQLVSNLIENAVKFNAPGGAVGVTLTNKALTVRNTGGFISPDDLLHVFEPFYQADTSHAQRGFGLGLAIVKKTVGLHGWRLNASSSAEAGTEFVVEFTPSHARRSTP
ncbi:MAG: HAMP domain-containing sensor histidine kinase [Candidatus Cryosericum sp.]